MKPSVCIHGHFYQPPRENPWLEEIETQDSAHPFHDWNQRITAECYAPNSSSRILGSEDRITAIVNNYAGMSFDFGPTLLSWLELHERETYAAILDADRISRDRFGGFGSALAQAYNHTILPLASGRDKRTQVLWGIRDFVHRFGRRPEGMWLPETAVDRESLDILAEQGIRFTVLAPHQAGRIRKLESKAWQDVGEASVDTRFPYLCRLESGRSIALFFYDGPLSREVAFGDILKHGRKLAESLTQGSDALAGLPQLRHIAVDGETFGHHHRFGEMALSSCLDAIEHQGNAHLTNYAEFLDRHPPQYEVEIVENTSWSCAHGVDRWRGDCGCHTGFHPEWTQAWRAPLRDALDFVREGLASIYERSLRPWTVDPWRLRDEYIDVILDRSEDARSSFLQNQGLPPLSETEQVRLWKLLEMQRAGSLMYTSCGWFFDDIAGIESVQVLLYAARALQLARDVSGEDFEPGFLSLLQKAPCNDPTFEDGRDLFEKKVKPAVLDLLSVGVHHGLASLFLDIREATPSAAFHISREAWERRDKGHVWLALGRNRVRSLLTGETQTINFSALYQGEHRLQASASSELSKEEFLAAREAILAAFQEQEAPQVLAQQSRFLGPAHYSLQHLFKDTKRRVVQSLLDAALQAFESAVRPFYARHMEFVQAVRRMNVPLPDSLSAALGFLRNRDIIGMLEEAGSPDLDALRDFAAEVRDGIYVPEEAALSHAFSRRLLALIEALIRDPGSVQLLEQISGLLDALSGLSLKPDLWQSQNLFFEWVSSQLPETRDRARSGGKDALKMMELAGLLGDYLSVEVQG